MDAARTAVEVKEGMAMASHVAELGNETAVVFGGVPLGELREQVEGLVQLFELTERMVRNPKWKASLVLPTLCRRSWRQAWLRWGSRWGRSSS